MAFSPVGFDKIDVLEVGVNGPDDANRLFIVSGVAVLNFQGSATQATQQGSATQATQQGSVSQRCNSGDNWTRNTVSFLVPQKGTDKPAPLNVGQIINSTSIAFPATIDSTPTNLPIGWGIDSVEAQPDGNGNLRLTACVVALNTGSQLIRMGFQINILAHAKSSYAQI